MLPIIQIGRIVKDIVVKQIPKDGETTSVMNNSLAIRVNKDDTVFIDITAWGKIAENIAKCYKKGNEILLTGELRSKKNKIENTEIHSHFILIKSFDFTYGNQKEEPPSAGEKEYDLPFKN